MADLNSSIIRGNLRVTDDANINGSATITGSLTVGTTITVTGGIVVSGQAVVLNNDSRLSNARTPVAHATTTTTYGVGTSSNYGHVKLGAANQNGATAADGVAAPNGHTHSQYLSGVSNGNPSADWSETVAIGTVGGTTLTFVMPDNPEREYYLVSDNDSSGGIAYVKTDSFTGGILYLKTEYLHVTDE